jgi:dihydroxyacetone kinase-like predicted kinase
MAEKLNADRYDICILIVGKEASMQEANEFQEFFADTYNGKELFVIKGDQEVYDYIMILE